MINEINLTPDFASLRHMFSRAARNRANTILAELLPEELIDPEHVKAIQLSVLREFQQVLNSLDVVTQCTTNLEQLVELRELVHDVSQSIITKANEIETNAPCEDEDEDEDDEPSEPEEGDWITNDHITFTQKDYPRSWANRVVVSEDEDWRMVLKAKMDTDQFWPDVWFMSDHGNAHMLDINDGQHIDKEGE